MWNDQSQTLDELETWVHKALANWHKDDRFVAPLGNLRTIQRTADLDRSSVNQATNRVLLTALNILQTTHEFDGILLKKRFVEGKTSFITANELSMAESTLFKLQKQAICRLTQVVSQMEQELRSKLALDLDTRVPARTYDRLFCANQLPEHLRQLLLSSESPWIIVLTGLGGIGKTALADTVFRGMVLYEHAFTDFAWISAQQQFFDSRGHIRPLSQSVLTATDLSIMLSEQLIPTNTASGSLSENESFLALQEILKGSPHLVVIDNLETLNDLQSLIPLLRKLADPTKFLVTSRESLLADPDVYQISVPELSPTYATELIRHEASLRHLSDVAAADSSTLHPIFDTVGGNPLALKLVVGQLSYLSLDRVLSNLREARGSKYDEFYRFIYWNSWQQLTVEAQSVLLVMPLFSDTGAELANIEQVADITEEELQDALEQLIRLSLVNVTGSFRARRYGIHRLTETFLLREVIKWTGTGPLDLRPR